MFVKERGKQICDKIANFEERQRETDRELICSY